MGTAHARGTVNGPYGEDDVLSSWTTNGGSMGRCARCGMERSYIEMGSRYNCSMGSNTTSCSDDNRRRSNTKCCFNVD